MRRGIQYLFFFAVTAFLAVFLLLPVWTVIETGSRPGLIAEIFRNRIYTEGLLNSFAVAVVTTSGVFVISLALALIYDRFDFPGKEMCNVLMLVPMILPPFVGALGFQQFLGHLGSDRLHHDAVVNNSHFKLVISYVYSEKCFFPGHYYFSSSIICMCFIMIIIYLLLLFILYIIPSDLCTS